MGDNVLENLPSNVNAEVAVLGCLVKDPSLIPVAAAEVKPQAFYSPAYRLIFQTLVELDRAGESDIDPMVLAAHLRSDGHYEKVNGNKSIPEIILSVPKSSEAAFRTDLDTVIRNWQSRSIWDLCNRSKAESLKSDPVEVAKSIDTSLTQILDVGKPSQSKSWREATLELVKTIEKRHEAGGQLPGLSTGMSDIDSLLNGLQPEYIILAARPSTGKTSLAAQWAEHLATNKIPVGIISLETTAERLVQRAISHTAKIPADVLEYGKFNAGGEASFNKFMVAAGKMAEWPIWVNDMPGLKLSEIDVQVRQWVQEHDIKCLFVDYLQLAESDFPCENETRETTLKSIFFKNIVSRYGIPLICLAQLNRGPETQKRRPRPSDLRSSGSIEQDADVIAFLHKVENDEDDDEDDDEYDPDSKEVDFIVAKGRNCGVGETRLVFKQNITAFQQKTF
jgi:replicative DNA helicase